MSQRPSRPSTPRPAGLRPRANAGLRPSQAMRLPMPVWDLPSRLFAAGVVLLTIAAFASLRPGAAAWHRVAGDAMLALLLFRLVWGFVGSDTARFARFLRGPASAAQEMPQLRGREPDNIVGHSTIGGWWLVVLLLLLAAVVVTGIAPRLDLAAPSWLAASHARCAEALAAALVLQALVMLVASRIAGRPLLQPLLTGKKRLPAATRAPRLANSFLATAIFVVIAAAVAAFALRV